MIKLHTVRTNELGFTFLISLLLLHVEIVYMEDHVALPHHRWAGRLFSKSQLNKLLLNEYIFAIQTRKTTGRLIPSE